MAPSTLEKQMVLAARFHEAWNEGARPGDLANLGFLDDLDPEDIQQLYSNLRLTQHTFESKAATLADYCEEHYIQVPGIDEIFDDM